MALSDAGFAVEVARDGRLGWESFSRSSPDLVILDLVMPELDGLELCRMIRRDHRTPVIMLTSKDDDLDKILGLEMGADDYVTKPFSTRVLIARIRAVLRRLNERQVEVAEALSIRGLRMDRARWEVRLAEQILELTATEFELLWSLASTPGRVRSRDQLIDSVYGEDIVVSHRTIDTFIKRLRKKLRQVSAEYDEIETVRSVGYRYKP